MTPLSKILADSSHFARGVELLTTRGTMEETKTTVTREFASELARSDAIDWVSITDNAGGNPQLSPLALGKRLLYAGKEVLLHISVGLTNFSFGVPKQIREGLENAYITLALEAGLDSVLGSPEKRLHPLEEDSKYLNVVRAALHAGRPRDGETQEEAGFRQSARIMDLF